MDNIIYVKKTDEEIEQTFTIVTYEGELLDTDGNVIETIVNDEE